jgi:sarcosine oxidase
VSAFDIIIVGLGGMGSAAAAHVAARGKRVLAVEQFQPGHTQGSSHGRSRVIRLAYFEHPAYVPLLRRSYELWRQLERDTGRRLLEMTGGLMIGTPDSEVVSGSLRSAREHDLDHEVLDAAEIHRRFPPLTPRQGIVAFYEKEAGSLFPEESNKAHLEVAARNGAALHFEEPVEDWQILRSGAVEVRTSRDRYQCDRLILAPGAWAPSLFKIDSLPLEVEPQMLYWFEPAGGAAPFAPDRFPIYIWDLGDPVTQHPRRGSPGGGGVQFYGFPADDEQRVKVAFFRSAKIDERSMRAALEPCLPALARGRLVDSVSCKYTLTPDHHFVIGLHPAYPKVVVASPCSGHGYKFASVIGEILADLATSGDTRHPIDLFAPSRFQ